MTSFLGIVKLTCRSAVRSHIFQLLFCLLVLLIFLIPNTIAGDGTAWGFIQISLKYSLSVIAFTLSLSTVWLGCSIMTQDVESYQLHMVISKPISRVTIWLGKCFGVIIINIVLLFMAALIVYGFILWQFNRQKFNPEEKSRIENEVLVGRKVFYPKMPNIDELARQEYKKLSEVAAASGKPLDNTSASHVRDNLKELKKKIMAGMSEVKPGVAAPKVWEYTNLPKDLKTPLFLRYRIYVDKISSSDQRETYGIWAVKVTAPDEASKEPPANIFEKAKAEQMKTYFQTMTQYPMQIMCGIFNEVALNPQVISPDGTVELSFLNFDMEKKSLYFQYSDGPKLLVKSTGFFSNYCRAVFMMALMLIILGGLACAAGSFLSMPTAIFTVISYLLFGAFSSFIVSSEIDMPSAEFADLIAYYVSKFLLLVVIPLQKFEVSSLLSNGELIEFGYMAVVFFNYFLVRGLPLFLIGIYLYWRREMGLVIRK